MRGPAAAFLAAHRRAPFLVTVISVGEVAVIFADQSEARRFLAGYRILRLAPEIAYAAAGIDRELISVGGRLGENDNWLAAFCRYYGQPLVSRDQAFDRVRGLRRLTY
jgi:predicted nucleic acid-binding protein